MTTYYSEPGVINAVDPLVLYMGSYVGLVPNNSTSAIARQNTVVLRGLIDLANAECASAPRPMERQS
jgi:hypothetical protein